MYRGSLKMNKNLKAISIVSVLFIALLSLTIFVSADSDLYSITQVEINGVVMSSSTVSDVELDDLTQVEVTIEGTGNSSTCPSGDVDDCETDVHVKAWIGGYEYDEIETISNEFTVQPGVSYRKTLSLDIPSDLDVQDDHDYTLYVEVYDSEDSERESYDIYADQQRHSVDIIDVIYDSSVKAGEKTPIEVRVENLGSQKEEDVEVTASLAGETAGDYINELAAYEIDNEDEESSDSAKMLLTVPKNIESGYYDLIITVNYNRGHDSIEETYSVWIEGTTSSSSSDSSSSGSSDGKTTVSLSSTSLEGSEGQASSFDVTFTNTGTESQTFMVTVNGEDQWASSSTSPSSVLVGPGASSKVTVTITPKDDAQGTQYFSLQILNADGTLVKDVSMNMSVDDSSSLFSDTGSMLKVGFMILIVLIIIIGLVIAFRKLKDDDDEDPLEPKDGKTYY